MPILCPMDHIEQAELMSNIAQVEQIDQSWHEAVYEVLGVQKVYLQERSFHKVM